jgi:hypothetical protein
LQKNQREDVVLYFETMADVLEEKLINRIDITQVANTPVLILENSNQ